jgi:hypothetical protein
VTTSDSFLEALLDALADRIATRIGTARDCYRYSSRDLPPRCSRRRFAEVCRSGRVADAARDGRDWVCSREAWEAARAWSAVPSRMTSAGTQARADALLARAGLRVVRGSR